MNRIFILFLFFPFALFSQPESGSDAFVRVTFIDKDTKQPLADVADTFYQNSAHFRYPYLFAKSGPKGMTWFQYFTIDDDDSYTIRASKNGYMGVRIPLSFPDNDTAILTVELEKSQFFNPSKGGFYGNIRDNETGAPLDSVRINVDWTANNDLQTLQLFSDSAGHFEIQNLDTHYGYRITYDCAGYRTQKEITHAEAGRMIFNPLKMEKINSIHTVSPQRHSKNPRGYIKLRFIDQETRQPVEDVADTLLVSSQGKVFYRSVAHTGPKGNTFFWDIPVNVTWLYSFKSHKGGYTNLAGRLIFPDNDTIEQKFYLERNYSFDTTKGSFYGDIVSKATGKPLDSAKVYLTWVAGKQNHSLAVNADTKGVFEFKNLEPTADGQPIPYKILILRPPYCDLSWLKWVPIPNTMIMFHSALNDCTGKPDYNNLHSYHGPCGILRLRFTDNETGNPLSNVENYISINKGPYYVADKAIKTTVESDYMGLSNYINPYPFKSVFYSIRPVKKGYVKTMAHLSLNARNDTLALHVEMDKDRNTDTTLASLHGVVLDHITGKALDSVTVTLTCYINRKAHTLTAPTDANGCFEFNNLQTLINGQPLDYDMDILQALNILEETRKLRLFPNSMGILISFRE